MSAESLKSILVGDRFGDGKQFVVQNSDIELERREFASPCDRR